MLTAIPSYRSRPRLAVAVYAVIFAVVTLRVTFAVWNGLDNDRGDFYATMPGAYAKTLNPALFDSLDFSESWVFQRDVFLYGPAQYLTMAPLVYVFDTYRELARFLLLAYALAITGCAVLMARMFTADGGGRRARVAVLAGTWLYLPLLQAYAQREFRVVIVAASVVATWWILRRREALAAAVIAYITWYKFFPLAWVPYFGARRWVRAVATYVAVFVAIGVVTQVAFGFDRFEAVWTLITSQLAGSDAAGLCSAWAPEVRGYAVANLTRADIRWGLCNVGARLPWLPVSFEYWGLAATAVTVAAVGFFRLERRGPLNATDESWRRVLEISLVLVVADVSFYAHYHYLAMLIIPLNALIARYLAHQSGWVRPVMWGVSYLALSGFVVPPALMSQFLRGVDVWRWYMQHAVYLYGELCLLALILWEYLRIPLPSRTMA